MLTTRSNNPRLQTVWKRRGWSKTRERGLALTPPALRALAWAPMASRTCIAFPLLSWITRTPPKGGEWVLRIFEKKNKKPVEP